MHDSSLARGRKKAVEEFTARQGLWRFWLLTAMATAMKPRDFAQYSRVSGLKGPKNPSDRTTLASTDVVFASRPQSGVDYAIE